MKKEIETAKKVAKDAAKVAVGVKVATKVSKDASKAIAVAKTVKKIEKKIVKDAKIISVKIDPDLNKELEKYSKRHKLSKNEAIVKAIEELVR